MAPWRSPTLRRLMRQLGRRIAWPVEAVPVWLLYGLCRVLPVDTASALGSRLARTLGPLLPGHRIARRNLERAFPDRTPAEIAAILTGMWDNVGRTIGEYPHLAAIATDRVDLVGREHVAALIAAGHGGILVSGHIANWEIPAIMAKRNGLDVGLIYRAPNNPHVDRLLRRARRPADATYLPKGAEGARGVVRILGRGGHVAMLIDQKMNDGIAVPFFGRDAMTAPAAARLALHFGVPILPTRIERLDGARFRLTVHPPLTTTGAGVDAGPGDRHTDVLALMTHLNGVLESWVRERPAEWLWMHRRWPT